MRGRAASPSPLTAREVDHDHAPCVASAMRRAEHAFEARGLRLTELRRLVLEEIISLHRSIGAYEVMDRLATRGHKLAPISVYRAIDALLEVGAIHRLESRNAFFACHEPHVADETRIILHCATCGLVTELDGREVAARIDRETYRVGFEVQRRTLEISGRCSGCRQEGAVA